MTVRGVRRAGGGKERMGVVIFENCVFFVSQFQLSLQQCEAPIKFTASIYLNKWNNSRNVE
jgi:hypothetical protein